MTKKEYFKTIFDRLTLQHKGVKINRVLCTLLMWHAGGNLKYFGKLKTLSKFLFRFDVSELSQSEFKPLLITFGYYPSRKDHRELMGNVSNKFGNESCYIDMSKWNTHKFAFSVTNILKSLNAGFFQMRGTGMSLRNRLQLSAWICFYLNTIDALSKVDYSSVKKYLCLANSMDLENLLTQLLKTKGVETYSLMEGVYFVQDSELPITDVAFFNLTSDIQLCWGQYSKDEFIKYGFAESRTKVVGYPKTVISTPMKPDNKFKKGVVLLSQYVMEEQNLKLINILSEFVDKQSFHIKLHPSLDMEKYSKLAHEKGMDIIPKEMTVNECVDNRAFDFAIAINSTAYYEALMRGLPCFRFYDGSYTSMAGYNDEFSDAESYLSQMNRIKSLSTEKLQEEINNALQYAVGWNIDNFRSILS